MLVLKRNDGESIMIGDDIRVYMLRYPDGSTKLGIEAPREVPVHRREVWEDIKKKLLMTKPEQHISDAPQTTVGRVMTACSRLLAAMKPHELTGDEFTEGVAACEYAMNVMREVREFSRLLMEKPFQWVRKQDDDVFLTAYAYKNRLDEALAEIEELKREKP